MSEQEATDEIALLPGEGDEKVERYIRTRHECEQCGDPATKRHTYLLPNARSNPRSQGYRGDDISRCEDREPVYGCDQHHRRPEVDGYEWCGTYTLSQGNHHLFLYWHKIK